MTKDNNNKTKNKNIITYFVMTVKSLALFIILIMISASICFYSEISYNSYYIFLLFSAVLSVFISSFLFTKKSKKNGLLNGIIASLPVVALLTVICLLMIKCNFNLQFLITILSAISAGGISGIIGVNAGR